MTTPSKTPAQAKTEADQKDFDAKVQQKLEQIQSQVEDLPAENPDAGDVAALYRQLLSLNSTVASCPPPLRKLYNTIVKLLFSHMDVIPGNLLLGDSDPRP